MSSVNDTLEERGTRYGNYLEQTKISKAIRLELSNGLGNKDVSTDQEDALTMIAVKLSRIVNGDPDYPDNWADIAGYATLVKDRLEGNERK